MASITQPEKPKEVKPSTRFQVDPSADLPNVGDMVHAHVHGKVVNVEKRKDRYGDGKTTAHVEIEHDPTSVKLMRSAFQTSSMPRMGMMGRQVTPARTAKMKAAMAIKRK